VDPLIIGLVAFSAILHVAWNVRLKTAGDPLRTATVGMLAAAVGIIPVGILVWIADGRHELPVDGIALGIASGRPYGQDGGVVQLPLALDKVLAGQSPYGADYSDSILGKEARVSDFWAPYGGNPILHHHAYLPGTHLLMVPLHLAARAWGGAYDPRFVTLLAYALTALLAARMPDDPARRLVPGRHGRADPRRRLAGRR